MFIDVFASQLLGLFFCGGCVLEVSICEYLLIYVLSIVWNVLVEW